MGRKVKTAIIIDNLGTFGQSPDEEKDEILDQLKDWYEIDPELVFYGHLFHHLPAEKEVDLVIVDYGALWQVDMSDESRLVVKWADDHPSSLVVLWSDMTADAIINDVLSPFDEATGYYKQPEFPYNLRPMFRPSSFRLERHDDEKCRTSVGTHVNGNPDSYPDCKCKCHNPKKDDWLGKSREILRTWFND